MVLEGHVGCPSIPGSCMRLDASPALMFSCHFSKLVKRHLIVSHKSGMFDDNPICLCKSVRGSLYHLFQWVIPVSFFPFLGCGVFPDDEGQRDTGYPITLVEEFINSIKGLWSISLWVAHPRYQCLGPPPLAWQCMHCTQGLEKLCSCLPASFLYLSLLGFSSCSWKDINSIGSRGSGTFWGSMLAFH